MAGPGRLIELITSDDDALRNASLDDCCSTLTTAELVAQCGELDLFRREASNLYERVRALFFLYAIHRFHLPNRPEVTGSGMIPFAGHELLLHRRFEEAIDSFLAVQRQEGPGDAISSALAAAYHRLAFQTLADQVRRSVRSVDGNRWMFRMGHPLDQPLRFRPELLRRESADGSFPILRESTPVRMDLTHSAWSDIFFLGMDYPEGARVLNVSVDLGVHGRDAIPRPPVSAWLRVIEEPILRLTSVDLGTTSEIRDLAEVFDFAKDYLGLLKAALIASGIVPPGLEGSGQPLEDLLTRLVGPGRGLEIVSCVNDIPKGSRLAVSTNLLAALISVCMRASGQTRSMTGPLLEPERRLVLARAVLGEWLGGSGGGWQDSGGVWPGIKLIQGCAATEGDPEFGVSRGRLMPRHTLLGPGEISAETRSRLQDSLVLVHGGMAQNVGPILEMVTEKYLLRSAAEWRGRARALGLLDEILGALREGDIARLGRCTSTNFEGPIQTIIPWASTHYTERLIQGAKDLFGSRFWGFWMLGGMSGGGMGFMFDPAAKAEAQSRMLDLMRETKKDLEAALPFAMDPVVYDFAINEKGTWAELLSGDEALMPPGYYALTAPRLLREDQGKLSPARRLELDRFAEACRTRPELSGMVRKLFDGLFPRPFDLGAESGSLQRLLAEHGFDAAAHEKIRNDLRAGRIGLAQNRMPVTTVVEDVREGDVRVFSEETENHARWRERGLEALARGRVGVVSLAAGAASRWTQGAGTVKSLNPFCRMAGHHRTFVEVHLAKSRRTGSLSGQMPPHVFTTSYLTHEPIRRFLETRNRHGYGGPLFLSPGRSIGLRMIPTVRDLRFQWEEMPQPLLDAQQQKVRESLRAALMQWALTAGEGADYTDNIARQCIHPVGHWYEIPNMLLNGTLCAMLEQRPELETLMLHNIDTLGANLEPALLGMHLENGGCLTFEVITRRLEDRGGGLARVDGRVRLVEGMALPKEELEFGLSYYNSMTTWIDIDRLLALFGLTRDTLGDSARVAAGVRAFAERMPTYITLKEVKKRWGHGQEDIFPVTQFEKLWSDLTAIPDVDCRFVAVPRERGQQLKEPAQLDGWVRDGSAAHVESLCEWE